MNPQDSNVKQKKIQQKQDVKNAISDYQGIEKNDTYSHSPWQMFKH